MAKGKIPVLTEVYKPKLGEKAKVVTTEIDATSDLAAKVTAQIKPRLASEITGLVLGELRSELKTEHQKQINVVLESIARRAENSAAEQIEMMHSHVGTFKQEAFAKFREELGEEKEKMLNTLSTEMQAILTAQMAEGQNLLKQNIEEMLNKAIPDVESRVRNQLTADLQQLLLKVKFVLPDN